MSKNRISGAPTRGPAAQADRVAKTIFDKLVSRPLPDHLVELADELDVAAKTGRLRRRGEAA